ncbi:PAS domain S-box protein [Fulvivirga sp.]|uniref:PAS domain-containing sensor histidine kinase n=1 Tax=Fulvivirga sp. TaxID=1931237 RepID=UPI0032EE6C64
MMIEIRPSGDKDQNRHSDFWISLAWEKTIFMDVKAALFEKICHSINDGILVVDQDGKIQWMNQTLEHIFGYSNDELLYQPLEILLPLTLRKKHKALRSGYSQSPVERPMGSNMEFEGLRKDGTKVWVRIALSFCQTKGQHFSIAIVSDKTEKRSMEFQSKIHAQRAQLFFDLSKALFLELDRNGYVQAINHEGCRILEYKEEEVFGKNWFDKFIDPKDAPGIKKVFNDLMEGNVVQTEFVNSHIITKSGKYKLIQWHNSLLTDDGGNAIGAISSGIDIAAIEELKKVQTEAMLIGTENERKRVAAELHDGIVQTLSAVSMHLKSFENNMHLLPDDNQKAYKDALKLVLDSISDTRAISHDLMPNAIIRDGLVSALNDLAERTAKYHHILVTIDPDHVSDGLSEIYRLHLYRIVQELIQNTLKHANASAIKIIIRKKKDKIHIDYQDDGHGFDDSLEDIQRTGLGLQNIITRVGSMSGDLNIKSSVKNGTKVNIIIPVSN